MGLFNLTIVDRVKISGGSDMEPRWLCGKVSYFGKCVAFISGQNDHPAAVVELEEPVTVDTVTGKIVVLELRFQGARWQKIETVHIELCDFMPENRPWKERRLVKWVESHATYTII